MTRRFMNVLRGYRGEAAKTKYLDRLRGLGQGENVGTKGSRPASKALYVQPFGQDLGTTLYLKCSALDPSWTALKGYSEISSRTKETIAGTDSGIKIKGFKPARIVRRTKDATGTVATSKLTGLKYMKYNQPSVSAPIGRKSATDTIGEAFQDVFTQIPGTFAVSLIQEDI
jgi:hypothetical protein